MGDTVFSSQTMALAGLLLIITYLLKLNASLKYAPKEAQELTPAPWTPQEIQETYERVKEEPFDWKPHLPPKLKRRYVVVGGSGMVGGDLVHLLLLQGHSPDDIRILDLRSPLRRDMSFPPANKVDFVKTDISSPGSLKAAFSKPWPAGVSKLPLTVFHTAALIRSEERHPIFYPRVAAINVGGTRNVLEAAAEASASIFVATSSASIAVRPAQLWSGGLPWVKHGKDYMQVYGEEDFSKPMRPHDQFFGNYAVSKAAAERLVCAANSPAFRTGCIRPANVVYGEINDTFVGVCLRIEVFPSWIPKYVQNFVSSKNVGLGHLQLEAALAQKGDMPLCAGRPFNISDPNPPIPFCYFYDTAAQLAETTFKVSFPPPAPLFILANIIEAYCVALAKYPLLTRLGLREPAGSVHQLQPATFFVSANLVASNVEARKPVAEGGLGYRGGITTLQGFCEEILEWNKVHGKPYSRINNRDEEGKSSRVVKSVEAAGAMAGGAGA